MILILVLLMTSVSTGAGEDESGAPAGVYSDWLRLDDLLKAGWRVGVAWQDGRHFGGTHTIRMNLALPASMLQEAFDRLQTYVFS